MIDPATPEEFPLDEAIPGPPSGEPVAPAPAPPVLTLTPEQRADFGLSECLPGDKYTANLTVGEGGEFVVDAITDGGSSEDPPEDVAAELLGYEPDDRRTGRGAGAPLDFGKMQSTIS